MSKQISNQLFAFVKNPFVWYKVCLTIGLVFTSPVSFAEDIQSKAKKNNAPTRVRKHAERYWNVIKSASASEPKKGDPDEITEYWTDIILQTMKSFEEMLEDTDKREVLTYYVERFGKDGAQADMRWLVAYYPVTMNNCQAGGLSPPRDNRSKRWREIQLLFAEIHVRHLLANPKILSRYYQAVVWKGKFIRAKEGWIMEVGNTERSFSKKSDEEYWWYARNFVLMAHATGRDDLLQNVKPENLKGQFRKWQSWLKNEGVFLRPSSKYPRWELDEGEKRRKEGYLPYLFKSEKPPLLIIPKYPFPDWKGPEPPPPSLLSELT